jgi:hypothetical protein
MAMEPIDTGTPEGGNTPPRPVKKITVKEIKRRRLADQNAKMCRALAQDDGVTLSDYVTLNYNPVKIAKIYQDYVEDMIEYNLDAYNKLIEKTFQRYDSIGVYKLRQVDVSFILNVSQSMVSKMYKKWTNQGSKYKHFLTHLILILINHTNNFIYFI